MERHRNLLASFLRVQTWTEMLELFRSNYTKENSRKIWGVGKINLFDFVIFVAIRSHVKFEDGYRCFNCIPDNQRFPYHHVYIHKHRMPTKIKRFCSKCGVQLTTCLPIIEPELLWKDMFVSRNMEIFM